MGPYDRGIQQQGATSVYDNPYYAQANAAASGYAAGSASATPNQYSLNNTQVLGAAGQGAASGFAAGGPIGAVVGAVVGGATSQAKQNKEIKRNFANVNTSFSSQQMGDAPVFNSAQISQGVSDRSNLLQTLRPGANAMGTGARKKGIAKLDKLDSSIKGYQASFNEANMGYQRQQLARRNYEDQLRNIYGIPQGYY
jgi:hypothetical protein